MRFIKCLFTATIAFWLLITGCSNSDFNLLGKSTDQKITVQKQVADGEYYEDFNEITIEKKVKKAIKKKTQVPIKTT